VTVQTRAAGEQPAAPQQPAVLPRAAGDEHRERSEHDDGDREAQHQVGERLDVPERVVHQREGGAEQQRREDQRALRRVAAHRRRRGVSRASGS